MLIKIVKSQRGFGFFGMMVLVIVLAVMGSIVMVTIDTTVSNQAIQETIAKMDRIQNAAVKFRTNMGAYPTVLDRLYTIGALTPCAADTAQSKMINWCGPYLETTVTGDSTDYIVDGWGTAFEYDGVNTLYSWGPNKTDDAGGSDDITRTFP